MMKRKMGLFALGLSVCAFILIVVTVMCGHTSLAIFMTLLHYGSMIIAFICLIGDVIRFVGKCFSQGFSIGSAQECSRVCPHCGKAISENARFCGECGFALAGQTLNHPIGR